jgi:DNA polymerase beta
MNKKIIDTLYQQLNAYRQDKSKKWKAIALQKAISTIKKCDFEITSSSQISNLPHIGNGMLGRIDEILNTGTLGDLANVKEYDTELIEKFKGITGVGDAKAKKWIEEGYKSIDDIKQAKRDGKIKLTHHIEIGLRYYEDFEKRIPRSEIKKIDKLFGKILKKYNKNLVYQICGSYRRGQKDSGDIDIIITDLGYDGNIQDLKHLSSVVKLCKDMDFIVDDLTTMGEKKYMGVCRLPGYEISRRIDIRCFNREEYPAAVLYFTGSKNFNVLVRQKAKGLGYSLNEYGLVNNDNGELRHLKSEEELFEILGIPYLEPTERDF